MREYKLSRLMFVFSRPEAVAQAVLYAIQNGESASVWMIIESKLFRLDMPDWTSFSEYITTFNKE